MSNLLYQLKKNKIMRLHTRRLKRKNVTFFINFKKA